MENRDDICEEYLCRICLDNCSREDVIAPCDCKGSSKWVHRDCLDRWRCTNENRAFSQCTVCKKPYVMISLIQDTEEQKKKRRMKFVFMVVKDITLGMLLLQLIIIFFAVLVWIFDKKSFLLQKLNFSSHPLTFYYLAGLTLLMSIVGILFLAMLVCPHSHDTGISVMDVYLWNIMLPSDSPCCVCCCDTNAASSSAAVSSSTCECCHCTECTCVECSSCSAEAIPLLLIVFGVLVFVGLVVSIFLGAYMIEKLIERHVTILKKSTLAKDFIVADLESLPDARSSVPSLSPSATSSLSSIEMVYHSLSDNVPSLPLYSSAVASSTSSSSSSSSSAFQYSPIMEEKMIDRDEESVESSSGLMENPILAERVRHGNNDPHASLLTSSQQRELMALGLV